MNDFVTYLNGLHNYSAQNQNAFGETNAQSTYYKQTMVDIDVCGHIVSMIENKEPHVIILTGHAGDGKTSIMYQVLDKLHASLSLTDSVQDVTLPDGKQIRCIKDFSELSDPKKHDILSSVLSLPSQGKYAFVVANTGPLINTFGSLFDDGRKEDAKLKLVEAMDSNVGDLVDIFGFKIVVINVAAIDNTDFARKYLDKILSNDELWSACGSCPNREKCHILCNRDLIRDPSFKTMNNRALDFIEYFYIYLFEHGTRLTIRSMTEQLAYMITGGCVCGDVPLKDSHNYRFFDLFFGYKGLRSDSRADNIEAIRVARKNSIFSQRLSADEKLLIQRDYNQFFSKKTVAVVEDIFNHLTLRERNSKEFDDEIRRIYFFLSIEKNQETDKEDFFSKQFPAYIDVRRNGRSPKSMQRELVIYALLMIYLGSCSFKEKYPSIPITMGADLGLDQNVQLVAGRLNSSDIELVAEPDSNLNSSKKNIILYAKKKKVCPLTLPILEHFEELRNGVIVTNMDPQLSHGIENLKATLLEIADSSYDNLDLLIKTNEGGFKDKSVRFEDNGELSFQ